MAPEERFDKIEENHLALQNVVLSIAEQQIRSVEETRRYFVDNDFLLIYGNPEHRPRLPDS
jgi:hypothetical protein